MKLNWKIFSFLFLFLSLIFLLGCVAEPSGDSLSESQNDFGSELSEFDSLLSDLNDSNLDITELNESDFK